MSIGAVYPSGTEQIRRFNLIVLFSIIGLDSTVVHRKDNPERIMLKTVVLCNALRALGRFLPSRLEKTWIGD